MKTLHLLASCLCLSTITLTATAQDSPPPRPREGGRQGMAQPLTPEKSRAAWELQARSVASSLGFDAEQTKATIEAYLAARTSHTEASDKMRKELMDKARDEGAQGAFAEIQQKTEELMKSEREKLEKSLSSKLSADQVQKAISPLGSFNRQWDTMTDALAGFGLDAAKMKDAQSAVQTYIVAVDKARAGGDREALRTATQEARKTLTDTMKGILSEDQMAKFQATLGGGRGMGGRPGGDGSRPDAPRPPANDPK
ncbi:MAG: hypothetical protein JNK25_00135 [Phycisphaerae bacterium]|nr:hypothetical protein [Phycisphaerae bacterium]